MNTKPLKQAVFAAFSTAILFWILFQASKIRSIMAIVPFAEDPYDAVASFAFEAALAAAILSLARLSAIKDQISLQRRAAFILNGILLIEACILATLVTYAISIAVAWPLAYQPGMEYWVTGMVILTLAFLVTGGYYLAARKEMVSIQLLSVSNPLGLVIRDCWGLACVIADWFTRLLPFLKKLWLALDRWIRRLASAFQSRFPALDPDLHPWGFVLIIGAALIVLNTIGIRIVEWVVEGPPPNIGILMLLFGIFFFADYISSLLVFLFLGGWLGLRPGLFRRQANG
jgi:hypothetical protein